MHEYSFAQQTSILHAHNDVKHHKSQWQITCLLYLSELLYTCQKLNCALIIYRNNFNYIKLLSC